MPAAARTSANEAAKARSFIRHEEAISKKPSFDYHVAAMSNDLPNSGETEVNTGVAIPAPTGVPRLTAVSGPGSGRSLAMAHALATAGRHATNDLVLNDPRISGVHLELHRVGNRIHVRDAGTTNGTWLGPHRVTE